MKINNMIFEEVVKENPMKFSEGCVSFRKKNISFSIDFKDILNTSHIKVLENKKDRIVAFTSSGNIKSGFKILTHQDKRISTILPKKWIVTGEEYGLYKGEIHLEGNKKYILVDLKNPILKYKRIDDHKLKEMK